MTTTTTMMLPLTTDPKDHDNLVARVGGKAASLMKLYSIPELTSHVPAGFALTVEFFAEWVDAVLESSQYKEALAALTADTISKKQQTQLCNKVKEFCSTLELSPPQKDALDRISHDIKNSWTLPLAAVRSSAPEEDGTGASFAGAFETVLGVKEEGLAEAARRCLASLFDYRVFSYTNNNKDSTSAHQHKPAFCAVVMEMVDSDTAGVAFSVNPINSDLDELVVDCSYGLGESVVDGSVVADRYVYQKIEEKMVEVVVGSKQQERRLDLANGGAVTKEVDEERQKERTLSDEQLEHLCKLVCTIEEAYKLPMDVEFAFMEENNKELKLLQARPITTAFTLDKELITQPGEPRILYYDFNVASEATTTEPFTHLDLEFYNKMCSILAGTPKVNAMFPRNTEMPMFTAQTRQYMNCSDLFRWVSPQTLAGYAEVLDPYLARTFDSTDCNREKYRAKKANKAIKLSNAIWLFHQFPIWTYYKNGRKYSKNPKQAKEDYQKIVAECLVELSKAKAKGMEKEKGLQQYVEDLVTTMMPALDEELAAVFVLLPEFSKLDTERREGKTKEIREEAEFMCGGVEGDPLMEQNIAMYQLAKSLPVEIWSEYDHTSFGKMAERIQDNIDGKIDNLPAEFLEKWQSFMKRFGYDGTPQLFVSSARYIEEPEVLLAMVSHSVGDAVKDPAKSLAAKVESRRGAMARAEAQAKKQWWKPWALKSVQKRNEILENLLWIRNAPKMNLSFITGMLREAIKEAEAGLIKNGRLEKPGDIFHLDFNEIDQALLGQSDSLDLMEIVRPRRARYEQAKRSKLCPMLVDSRNRILRPDVKSAENSEPGTLVGAAISPGVATGRVRIVTEPTEPFETGEVLAAVVTDPAWTPLFVGAAAVVFQIGGALQHGALCAREYGKPGVSGIDVHACLKDGMLVSVDGNTGVVKILEEPGRGEDQL